MEPGITVSGSAEVAASPDVATVTLGVAVVRPGAPEAVAAAAQAATVLLGALAAVGVSDDDVRTVGYGVDAQMSYPPDGPPRRDGYRVSHQVVATVRDVTTVGAVLDAAVAAAGDDTTVSGVAFDVADPTALRAEARAAALADARATAEQLATLAGRPLGEVVAIEAGDVGGGIVPMPKFAAARSAAPTPVATGQVTVAAAVTVRWAFTTPAQ